MPEAQQLVGPWRHSFEEDHDDVQVFRRADFDFPRARGRTGFEIQADGTFIDQAIGPDDRSLSLPGSWDLSGEQLRITEPGGDLREIQIVQFDGDRLELRRTQRDDA